jgi:hypothetical protein
MRPVSSVLRPSRGSSSYAPTSTRSYTPGPYLARLAWLLLLLIGAITLTVLYALEHPPKFSKSKHVSVTVKDIISVSSRVPHICAKRSRTGARVEQPDDIVEQLYPSSRRRSPKRCTQYKQGKKEYDVVVMVEIPGVDELQKVSRRLKEYPKIGDTVMAHVHNDKIVSSPVGKPVWLVVIAIILYIIVFFGGRDFVRDLMHHRRRRA